MMKLDPDAAGIVLSLLPALALGMPFLVFLRWETLGLKLDRIKHQVRLYQADDGCGRLHQAIETFEERLERRLDQITADYARLRQHVTDTFDGLRLTSLDDRLDRLHETTADLDAHVEATLTALDQRLASLDLETHADLAELGRDVAEHHAATNASLDKASEELSSIGRWFAKISPTYAVTGLRLTDLRTQVDDHLDELSNRYAALRTAVDHRLHRDYRTAAAIDIRLSVHLGAVSCRLTAIEDEARLQPA